MKRGDFRTFHDRMSSTYVLSVYLDGRADDPAMNGAWRVRWDAAVDRLRADTAHRAPRQVPSLERALAVVDDALSGIRGRLPMDGLVLFASETELLHREDVPCGMDTRVAWKRGPLAGPYLEALLPDGRLYVVDVTLDDADLYAWNGARELDLLTRFEVEVTHEAVESVGVLKGVRGTSGFRGASAQDEREQALHEDRRRMLADIVTSLSARVGPEDLLFVYGSQAATGELTRMLPAEVARRAEVRIMEARHGRPALAQAAREGLSRMEAEAFDSALADVVERSHRDGRGALGLFQVRRAANRGAVDTLLLDPAYVQDHPSAAEPLIAATYGAGGTVLAAGGPSGAELDRVGCGVAARLRYPIT